MKALKKIIVIAIFLFTSTTLLSQSKEVNKHETTITRCDARIVDQHIYFNLCALNDSEMGFYSLVGFENDSTFFSVDIKEAHVNNINHPILYCFNSEIKKSIKNYVLYRIYIDKPTEIIMVWDYNHSTNSMLSHPLITANI